MEFSPSFHPESSDSDDDGNVAIKKSRKSHHNPMVQGVCVFSFSANILLKNKKRYMYYRYINYSDHLTIKWISGSFLSKDLVGNKRTLHVFNIILNLLDIQIIKK